MLEIADSCVFERAQNSDTPEQDVPSAGGAGAIVSGSTAQRGTEVAVAVEAAVDAAETPVVELTLAAVP